MEIPRNSSCSSDAKSIPALEKRAAQCSVVQQISPSSRLPPVSKSAFYCRLFIFLHTRGVGGWRDAKKHDRGEHDEECVVSLFLLFIITLPPLFLHFDPTRNLSFMLMSFLFFHICLSLTSFWMTAIDRQALGASSPSFSDGIGHDIIMVGHHGIQGTVQHC